MHVGVSHRVLATVFTSIMLEGFQCSLILLLACLLSNYASPCLHRPTPLSYFTCLRLIFFLSLVSSLLFITFNFIFYILFLSDRRDVGRVHHTLCRPRRKMGVRPHSRTSFIITSPLNPLLALHPSLTISRPLPDSLSFLSYFDCTS
jgi:hypothetical protein